MRHRSLSPAVPFLPPAQRSTPPTESFIRRFDCCFDLAYRELRAHHDPSTARRLVRAVLTENLDLLVVDAGDEAAVLAEEQRRRLLASIRRLARASTLP